MIMWPHPVKNWDSVIQFLFLQLLLLVRTSITYKYKLLSLKMVIPLFFLSLFSSWHPLGTHAFTNNQKDHHVKPWNTFMYTARVIFLLLCSLFLIPGHATAVHLGAFFNPNLCITREQMIAIEIATNVLNTSMFSLHLNIISNVTGTCNLI